MYRAAYLLSGDRVLAEDAAQEAFARAFARWRRLGGEPWAAGWIMTTALNVVRRALRHRAPIADRPPGAADLDALLDLRAAVRGLPPRQQTAVVLYYLADLPVPDVARAMGCRQGTVRAHLAKARTSLALRLAPGRDGAPIVPALEEGARDA